MLLAGLVHGDLSDFNVLMGVDGPVIIDFPQAVDSARNNLARKLLIRDVDNLVSFLARFAPELKGRPFGREMWDLYTRNELRPDTVLTGRHRQETRKANTSSLLDEIDALAREARRKREALGLEMRPARKPKFTTVAPTPPPPPQKKKGKGGGGKPADPFDDLDRLLLVEDE
jgi:RIO kinase 1